MTPKFAIGDKLFYGRGHNLTPVTVAQVTKSRYTGRPRYRVTADEPRPHTQGWWWTDSDWLQPRKNKVEP
jgi:hypothetical protein